MKLYKAIKGRGSYHNLDEFEELIEKYNRMCKIIHDMCNIYRKTEYQHWINTGCEYMKSHNPKKAWKWLKTTAKVDKFKNMSNSPVKDKNGKLATSTKEQLEVWHNHYKKLASSHSDINSALIEWYNKFSNGTIRYTRHNEWDINQDISIEEIKEAILATPNYKASGPDGIPIEFYKALIPPDDENSVNNSASGLNCLQKIYSRIWNGEFPSTWNEASIISIPKKGDDLFDCDNYRGISLINNDIKLISKIVSKRISEYGLKNHFIRPEQFGFRNKEESVSFFISIRENNSYRNISNSIISNVSNCIENNVYVDSSVCEKSV